MKKQILLKMTKKSVSNVSKIPSQLDKVLINRGLCCFECFIFLILFLVILIL